MRRVVSDRRRKSDAGAKRKTLHGMFVILVITVIVTQIIEALKWQPTLELRDWSQEEEDANAPQSLHLKKEYGVVHVLYGLHGDNKGFMDQWEVNLKSTLLNAPLDHPLHIHIIVNSAAEKDVEDRLRTKAQLFTMTMRNPISITIYNVEGYHDEWTKFLLNKFRGMGLDGSYPMGVYYRLLAHRVILPHMKQQRQQQLIESPINRTTSLLEEMNPILYMDADVVVLTNLNDLWRHVIHDVDSQTIYQWSATTSPNSGFAVYYLQRMDRFWELIDQIPTIPHTNDQSLLINVGNVFPHITGALPVEWDTHMGHGWRPNPHTLMQKQLRVGIAHFTGKPPSGKSYLDADGVIKYCQRVKSCGNSNETKEDFMRTWGLVDYYIRIPWHYVRYLCESKIPIDATGQKVGGHMVKLEIVNTSQQQKSSNAIDH